MSGLLEIDFIKGHMGGNRILLLDARQLPAGRELEIALHALSEQGLSAHQAGLCAPGSADDSIRVRVVSISWRDYIPACGGLTQVLGRALSEGLMTPNYGLSPGEDGGVNIEFDAWPARVRPRADLVETDLSEFARLCQKLGVEAMRLGEIDAWRAGTFLVLDAEHVENAHPGFNGARLDESDQAILQDVHKEFQRQTGQESWDFALYDWRPTTEAHLRVVFPHAIPIGHIEPACGTGTVALGLALTASGQLAQRSLVENNTARLVCETGGGPKLGGDEQTWLDLDIETGRVVTARLRHSRVELLAQGKLLIHQED
ncbi:MAG: hypothetical protein JRF33_13690 [Deltaproteobacteria bacterium]|nr:hypothetical protein [Deltaproteobacteria bacterium]